MYIVVKDLLLVTPLGYYSRLYLPKLNNSCLYWINTEGEVSVIISSSQHQRMDVYVSDTAILNKISHVLLFEEKPKQLQSYNALTVVGTVAPFM